MKKTFLLLLLGVFSMSIFANDYKLNEQVVDDLFSNATEVVFDVSNLNIGDFSSLNGVAQLSADKNPAVAWILTWVFVGVHRLYLGTETMTFVKYVVTCGGCTIVQLVDWYLLLMGMINNDISKYVDNPNFFMWK